LTGRNLQDTLDELADLLKQVEWHQPLDSSHAERIRDCAAFARDRIDEDPAPLLEQLVLLSALDAILHWIIDPQDRERIERVHKALGLYWRTCAYADEALP
jgi:hypothetical protein